MIRKTILAAGILLAALTAQGPARAQTVPDVSIPTGCNLSVPGIVSWSYQNVYNCGATVNDVSLANTALNNIGGFAGKWYGKTGYIVFLYPTQAAYIAQSATFGANYVAPTPAKYTLTKLDANNNPLYSVIFEKNGIGAGVANPYFEYSAAREVAKNVDYSLGFVANGGVYVQPNISYSSNTTFTNYNSQLNNGTNGDWAQFNSPHQCNTTPTSGDGLFTGIKSSTGIFICGTDGNGTALNPAFSPTPIPMNQAVLQKAWPDDFGVGGTGLLNQPAFAAILASPISGSGSPIFYSTHYGTQFNCANFLARFVASNGVLPVVGTGGSLGSACPALATAPGTASNPVTNCTATFNGGVGFPQEGAIFDCTGDSDSLGSGVANALGNLGTVGSTVTPVGKFLKSKNAVVYLFNSNTDFTTDFGIAGVSTAGMALGVANAATAPIGTAPVWYTAVYAKSGDNTGGTGSPNSSRIAYVIAHELGHTLDFNINRPGLTTKQPSASAQFDLAMQNDILNLDWSNFATRTFRNPCAAGGPLVNLTDPTTNDPFCSGTVLEPKWQSGSTTIFVHTILQQTATTIDPQHQISTTREISYQNTTSAIGNSPGQAQAAGWKEWVAQAFAIQVKKGLPPNAITSNRPVLDAVVANGWFPCTAGYSGTGSWLSQLYASTTLTTTPLTTTPCQTALPTGYTTATPPYTYRPVFN